MPLSLILNPTDEMEVMQDEIFGPIFPIKTYDRIEDAIEYVNSKPHPLALYYFGRDSGEEDAVVNGTTSGGVTVNDIGWHAGQDDLPFGGVGASGMGAYHGLEGFRAFSHARSVFRQARIDLPEKLGVYPPYGEKFDKFVGSQIRK